MQKTIIGILLSCSILLSGCTRTYKVDYPQKYAKLLTEQLGDWKVVNSFERHFSSKFSLPYNATFWKIEYTDYKGNARELTIRNDINIYVCLLDYTMDMLKKGGFCNGNIRGQKPEKDLHHPLWRQQG